VAEEVQVGGRRFAKGMQVILNIKAIAHDATIWPRPFEFRPERFLEASAGDMRPFDSVPLSVGARSCIGK
jgi:cytochrome P450